jgi:hypothetical protein
MQVKTCILAWASDFLQLYAHERLDSGLLAGGLDRRNRH